VQTVPHFHWKQNKDRCNKFFEINKIGQISY